MKSEKEMILDMMSIDGAI